MKNSKLRSILFVLLLFASIGSYLYINSVQVEDSKVKCEVKQQLVDEEANETELPDVMLFKKLIEKGKELFPATQL